MTIKENMTRIHYIGNRNKINNKSMLIEFNNKVFVLKTVKVLRSFNSLFLYSF